MMRTKLLTIFLLSCISLSAYSSSFRERERLSFAVHAGYANMTNGPHRLTKNTASYKSELSSGLTWDSNFHFQAFRYFGIGLLYSGYTSKGSHTEGSDHISTHYFAPQLAIYLLQLENWEVRINGGLGGMSYLNNSKVFGKDRKVDAGSVAGNIGATIEYRFNRVFGISLEAFYIGCNPGSLSISYHDEKVHVDSSSQNPMSLSRVNISLGATLHF